MIMLMMLLSVTFVVDFDVGLSCIGQWFSFENQVLTDRIRPKCSAALRPFLEQFVRDKSHQIFQRCCV